MSSDVYWGEIPTVADTDSGIAALEREQITRPRAMEVDGPPLHQPSSRHYPPTNEILTRQCTQMDPVVIHSIRLLQHIKKLQAVAADTQNDIKSDPDTSASNVGPIPVYDGPPIPDPTKKKVYTEENYNRPFVRGEGETPPVIEEVTCRKLLRRSTAAICAHLSFESTSESVLETLTDMCHEFICQMTRHLAEAADRRATHGCLGFPDIMERVFHEMGLGSVSDLQTFYQQRVLNYHKRLIQQCETLMSQHNSQLKQSSGSPSEGDTFNVIRIKEETSGDMNFPLLDENDEVNEAEHLLNIESLGTFEITVEHETASGLTTEVDSKWPLSGKTVVSESRLKSAASLDEASESESGAAGSGIVPVTPQSVKAATPLENVTTPLSANSRDPSSQEEVVHEVGGSVSSSDIFSPSAPKAKKRKK